MKLRRSLLVAGVPLAAALPFASTALAAGSSPPVTVRIEGASRTLLQTRTVTVHGHGWVRKGGTPAGACPADSAAGALGAATRGHWNGTFYKGLGIAVSTLRGRTLSFSHGSYWGFYVDNRLAPRGICETKLVRGESLLFAPVPAKGRTPMPIVVRAPRTVRAGRSFLVRAFVHTGSGAATRPVTRPRYVWSMGASTNPGRPKVTESRTGHRGTLRFRISGVVSAHATLVVSAPHEIRSAAHTIRVIR